MRARDGQQRGKRGRWGDEQARAGPRRDSPSSGTQRGPGFPPAGQNSTQAAQETPLPCPLPRGQTSPPGPSLSPPQSCKGARWAEAPPCGPPPSTAHRPGSEGLGNVTAGQQGQQTVRVAQCQHVTRHDDGEACPGCSTLLRSWHGPGAGREGLETRETPSHVTLSQRLLVLQAQLPVRSVTCKARGESLRETEAQQCPPRGTATAALLTSTVGCVQGLGSQKKPQELRSLPGSSSRLPTRVHAGPNPSPEDQPGPPPMKPHAPHPGPRNPDKHPDQDPKEMRNACTAGRQGAGRATSRESLARRPRRPAQEAPRTPPISAKPNILNATLRKNTGDGSQREQLPGPASGPLCGAAAGRQAAKGGRAHR